MSLLFPIHYYVLRTLGTEIISIIKKKKILRELQNVVEYIYNVSLYVQIVYT